MADQTSFGDFVTYRDLVATLDHREAKITAQVYDVSRRVEHLDDHGSRGLQRVSDQLAAAVAELRRHTEDHKTADSRGISGRQWTLTTLVASGGLLVALWDHLPK